MAPVLNLDTAAGAVEEEIATLFEAGDEEGAYLKLYDFLSSTAEEFRGRSNSQTLPALPVPDSYLAPIRKPESLDPYRR
jgi:hypothetical protein